MDDNQEQKSIWNIDGAQFYALFQIKQKFVDYMLQWDLENAYWTIRTLRMEIDAKLKRKETNKVLSEIEEEKIKLGKRRATTEKEEVDELMDGIDDERIKFLNNEIDKGQFFKILESFYMYLCHLMKKHQMYYREGEDNRLAVLRR